MHGVMPVEAQARVAAFVEPVMELVRAHRLTQIHRVILLHHDVVHLARASGTHRPAPGNKKPTKPAARRGSDLRVLVSPVRLPRTRAVGPILPLVLDRKRPASASPAPARLPLREPASSLFPQGSDENFTSVVTFGDRQNRPVTRRDPAMCHMSNARKLP